MQNSGQDQEYSLRAGVGSHYAKLLGVDWCWRVSSMKLKLSETVVETLHSKSGSEEYCSLTE